MATDRKWSTHGQNQQPVWQPPKILIELHLQFWRTHRQRTNASPPRCSAGTGLFFLYQRPRQPRL
jgi:hypothetical protein